jgi:hypothetical protein
MVITPTDGCQDAFSDVHSAKPNTNQDRWSWSDPRALQREKKVTDISYCIYSWYRRHSLRLSRPCLGCLRLSYNKKLNVSWFELFYIGDYRADWLSANTEYIPYVFQVLWPLPLTWPPPLPLAMAPPIRPIPLRPFVPKCGANEVASTVHRMHNLGPPLDSTTITASTRNWIPPTSTSARDRTRRRLGFGIKQVQWIWRRATWQLRSVACIIVQHQKRCLGN